MKGHEPLIAMRRQGKVPQSVWFGFDGDGWKAWAGSIGLSWRQYPQGTVCAEVMVEPADVVERLDLRFVVGIRCWVQGDDADRVKRLHKACAEAGADRVLSIVLKRDPRGVDLVGEMLDTAGHFVGA